jgi:hypothetical protein
MQNTQSIIDCCGHCGNKINEDAFNRGIFKQLYDVLPEFKKDEVDIQREGICLDCFMEISEFFTDVEVDETTNEDLLIQFEESEILAGGYRLFNQVLVGLGDNPFPIIDKMLEILENKFGDYGYIYLFNSTPIGNLISISLYCKPEQPIILDNYKNAHIKLRMKLREIKNNYGVELKSIINGNRIELHILSPINTIICTADFFQITNIENHIFYSEFYTEKEKTEILSGMLQIKINDINEEIYEIIMQQV